MHGLISSKLSTSFQMSAQGQDQGQHYHHHRHLIEYCPNRLSLFVLLAFFFISFNDCIGTAKSSFFVSAFARSHPTKVDSFMRTALCSNQVAMCAASCQNNVLVNACNTETLEWSCTCNAGTSYIINRWEFPIPFKLCRIQLLDCLKSCPEIFDQTAPDDQIRIEAQTQNFNGNKDRRNNISNKNETLQSHNDMDQDDYDAILELQALHRHGRLEESSYSQFHVERLREQINIKKKQLHKKLWTVKQKEKLRKKQQRVKGSDRMFLQVDRNTGSFTTVIDPSAYHEVECEMACHKSFACGTETAPIS